MPMPERWPARPLQAARAAPRERYRRRPRRREAVAPAAPRSPRGDHVLYVGEDARRDEAAGLQLLDPPEGMTAARPNDPRGGGRSDARKRLELAGGRVVHVDLELRVAPGAPRGDRLARARYVDALAVVDGRGFVEHLEVGFPCHAAGGDKSVDDP